MPKKHPRDPKDPAYPHGTQTGRNLGCRKDEDCPNTPTCAEVTRRAAKASAMRKAGYWAKTDQDMVPAGPVRDHVRALLAISGATQRIIARLAGLGEPALSTLLAEGKQEYVRISTARKVRAITPADVRAHIGPSHRKVVQVAKSLQAQGWPLTWQSQELGHTHGWLNNIINRDNRILPSDARNLLALAARLERLTGPHRQSAALARLEGWHPLACYDDDGNLIGDAIRDEAREAEMASRAARAQQVLAIARHAVHSGISAKATALECGTTSRDVVRIRRKLGLYYRANGDNTSALDPASRGRAAEIADLLAEQDSLNHDPLEFVTGRLGIAVNSTLGKTKTKAAA